MRPADNPFSAHSIDRVPFYFADETADWDAMIALFAQNQFMGSVIGPHGTGKTTFLTGFTKALTLRGFETLPLFINLEAPFLSREQRQSIKRASPDTIICFDGGDLLPWWAWWRFRWVSRHVKGLFITSHGSKRLPDIYQTHSNAQLLHNVLCHLLGDMSPELRQQSAQLLSKHQGNMRDVLRDLYWVYVDQ